MEHKVTLSLKEPPHEKTNNLQCLCQTCSETTLLFFFMSWLKIVHGDIKKTYSSNYTKADL